MLAQEKPQKAPAGSPPELKGFAITGLPLTAFNDDLGLTYGARLIGTFYQKGYAPYRYQIWGQYLNSTLGFENHAAMLDYISQGGLRSRIKIGYRRDLLADYYGYGNHQDIRRNRQVIGDQKPVIPVGTNQVRMDLGPRELEDSQNRYYNYEYAALFLDTSVEDWLGQSNFKWFAGFLGNHYTVRSYHGDVESGEDVPNILTYIDIEQPVGYETIRDDIPRNVNLLRTALIYDSRPRLRENDPNSGIFTDLHYENSGKLSGSDYEYSNVTLTWRQYLELFPSFWNHIGMESIFAYRLMAYETIKGTAPFFDAGTVRNVRKTANGLGGLGGIRGFPSNQFIDRFITIANLELRHTFSQTQWAGGMDFQTFFFYDLGRVAPSRREWQARDFHRAYGPGLVTIWQKNTVIMLFFGFSEFHSFTAFTFNHTF